MATEEILRLEDVVAGYGRETILNGLSFGVPRGAITTTGYDSRGNVVTVTDPNGWATTYSYDAANRKTATTDPQGNSATFAYDAASRLSSTTDRLGRRIDYSYDAADRQTGQAWYAAGGSLTTRVTLGYDAVGNLTSAANAVESACARWA